MLRIKAKITLLVIACILLSSLSIGLVAIYKGEEALIKQAKKEMLLRANEADQRINVENMRLETAVNDLETVVMESFDAGKAASDANAYFAQYTELLKPIVKAVGERTDGSIGSYVYFKMHEWNDNVNYVWYGKEAGEFVWQVDDTPVTEWDDPENSDYVWYHGPIKAGKGIWTELYVDDALGYECISYVKPIYQSGNLIGVVGMDMSFEKIGETIQSVNAYDTGYAFMTDKNNQYVVSPNASAVEAGSAVLTSTEETCEDCGEGKGQAPASLTGLAVENSGIIEQDGRMIAYIKANTGNTIFVSADREEIVADIALLMKQFAMIIAIVVLAMTVIGYIFASGISSPIKKLRIAADEATNGNFDIGLPVATSKDEVSELIGSIEMLIAALKMRVKDKS